ncbi:MAG: SDR family NAD(P)-dependent oxidoreductase [Actinomycetota bacterium]
MWLHDRVIGVVGASGGLGAPISRQLVERGARVVAAGRDEQRLHDLGLDGPTVSLDLRDSHAGNTLVQAALDAYGRLDGVVNAAGIVAFGDLAVTDDVVIEELFLTNVLGPLWLMRCCLPQLVANQGVVANLSAVVAEQPLPGMAAYAASKAALTAADVALARELRRKGVRVLDVRPPHTETGLATRALAGEPPRLPEGLDPELVASVIVDAMDAERTDPTGKATELPSSAFDA